MVGVFAECDFSIVLNRETLNLSKEKSLPGMNGPTVPFVILADAAFPLQKHLKPYPFRNMSTEVRIFNYLLSRRRRVIQNAFGILTNRFRILLNPMNLKRDSVVLITQTCCVLHSFLRRNIAYTDSENENIDSLNVTGVSYRRARSSNQILQIRETFKYYFNNIHRLPWQKQLA